MGIDAGLPPLLFAALRFAIAGPITLGIVLLRGLPLPRRPAQYGALAVVGFFSTTIVYATLFWAEQYLSTRMATILGASSPLIVMLVGRRWNHSARWVQVAGLVTGFLGVALALLPHLRPGPGAAPLGAAALLLMSGLGLALGSVRGREIMEGGIHPLTVNAFQMLLCGLGLLLCSLLFEFPAQFTMGPATWAALAHLSIAGSVVGFGIFYWLVSRTGPLFPATWTYVAPITAPSPAPWCQTSPSGGRRRPACCWSSSVRG